ncbi:unnamed protein product [Paramecium primaurelia]|uniref:Uncharacterized protein n=2 Tax=Paramecium TaxID=5884 RepID=A0A8S1TQY1_9CILI|nr:unnamed protein product [Paramecium primaurelia]CAD8154428.1 unnamed protein product [Paramecium pentaurelia]
MIDGDEQKKMENEGSYGYFTILAVKFTSSEQQIDRNYNTLIKFYTDKEYQQGDSQENLNKTNEAYKIIKDEKARESYMHKLMIRCYLSQPFDLILPNKQSDKLWPFFIFEVIKEGKSTSEIMQFNFSAQTLTEQKKDVRTKSYMFSNISSALYSKKDDEFIINFIENGKILSQNYKAKFQNQRDQLVKLAIFAKEIFEETKPTLEFHNPNTKQDLNLFKVQHYSIGENSKTVSSKVTNLFFDQVSTKNYFLWNDSYIPPHSLLKTSASKLASLGQSKTVHFTIGKSQMLVSRDEDLRQIIQVIPLKKEYLAFSRDENVVQLQVLNNTRKYRFHDKQGASQFVQKLISVQNQKASATPLMTEYPFGQHLQNIVRSKKSAIQKLNSQIAQYEQKVQQLKVQRQQLLSDFNDLDLDKVDDDELMINKEKEQQNKQSSFEPASLFKAPVKFKDE